MQGRMGAQRRGEAQFPATGRRRRLYLPFFAGAVLALLTAAPAAQATFHEIKVREVYAGGSNNDSYVVLQAYSAGQNQLNTHKLSAYNSTGTEIGSFTFSSNVSNSQNQMTVLVADTSYASTFPSGPSPDGTSSNLDLSPTGGAVCWAGVDCVTWGNFSGTTTPATSSPVDPSGIPANMAIRRTIAPNCATLLEAADDTNASSTDFFNATPNPRANSSPITEMACTSSAPDTTITSSTPSATRTNSTEITFSFTASPSAGATFECKLDAEAFSTCTSSKNYTGLTGGAGTSHTFQVRAVHPVNGTDPTPATHTWTVDTQAPTATIDTHPADPSSGTSAPFTFHSSETNSTFQCSLTKAPEPDAFSTCSSPKTFTHLANGIYMFKVRAKDEAGNQGAPAEYEWEVDNSLADTTPPETTITSKPPDPSESTMASFTYESNEPGSTFECKLDAAEFAPCAPTGITYTGLASGTHTFEVQATDTSANTDESPAGYTWNVAVMTTTPPVVPPPPPPPPRAAGPPNTKITVGPPTKTHDRTPTFRFRASETGATYKCKLDHGPFKPCRSPFTTKTLSFGKHTIQVDAIAGALSDPSPAKFSFRVVKG
jgi:hypothetical protein